MDKQEDRSSKYAFNMFWIKFIPLIILVSIVPLLVRIVPVKIVEEEAISIWNTTSTMEFFSQFKASVIMLLIGIILIISFFIFNKKDVKKDPYLKLIYIATIVYVGAIILSVICSKYKHTAWWGIADRAEGGIMLIAYVIMLLYTLYIIKDVEEYGLIVNGLTITVVLMTFLGFYQYIGKDLFVVSEWGKQLIIPDKYKEYRESIEQLYTERRAYGTLFHYNYIGSFTAMMIPLFGVLALFTKGYIKKLIYAIVCVSSVFLLFFSTSRAGIIGLSISMVILIIMCAKIIIRKWKLTLPILLVIMLGVIGVNKATEGQLFERIPSLVEDISGFFTSGEEGDYKESLPLQGIQQENGQLIIQVKQHTLYVTMEQEGLVFKDEKGEPVSVGTSDTSYIIKDERFNQLKFSKLTQITNVNDYWALDTSMGRLVFGGNLLSGLQLVDINSLEPIELVEPEAIGFKGKERIGSARGYIWSRSLPILKEHILVGSGPDCFVFEFPQQDYLGKMCAYGTTNMLIDKPHNLYLQIGINQGGIALVAFLIMIGVYLIQSIKLYGFRSYYQERYAIGMAIMLAIVGYLGAGIFNDSVVSVAPIFWVLLGTGMAINYLNAKMNRREEQAIPHATIDMKKRKHIKTI